jgi:hypothetical protein
MKYLTEKQLHTRLDNFYKEHFGNRDTDEWYVNPAENIWKFVRNGRVIILECDMVTGEITVR